MIERDDELRHEEPTPFRRAEARERGRVPRSRDLAAALAVLGGVVVLRLLGPRVAEAACGLARSGLSGLEAEARALASGDAAAAASRSLCFLALAVLPAAAGAWVATLAAGVAQGGVVFRAAALAPDPSRLSPLGGARRLLGLRGLGRAAFALSKLAIAGWILASALEAVLSPGPGRAGLSSLEASTLEGAWAACWTEAASLAGRLALGLLVLAVLDYAWQRWLHERDLRMTRAEAIEEAHRLEGDPAWKRRRRRFFQEHRLRGGLPRARRGPASGRDAAS
ncbi:MAG: EscU/YscU/HrcU family type III secretion system export apparatus switch protein [Planctomycetes bacterium]|nr:EscU/YscU/HrcU family type III secretion system export apparatus switch protein [Planctomycetota bacterium]